MQTQLNKSLSSTASMSDDLIGRSLGCLGVAWPLRAMLTLYKLWRSRLAPHLLLCLVFSCHQNNQTNNVIEPIKTPQETNPLNRNNEDPGDKGSGLETKGTYEGQLSSSEIQPVFAAKNTELHACYDNGKSKNKYLQGNITIRFEITPEGKADKVFAEISTFGEGDVESCFLGIVGNLIFPKPTGGAVLATYPISFQPSAQLAGIGEPTDTDKSKYVSKTKESLKKCKKLPADFQVSVWIDPEGKAMSAGFSAASFEGHEARACAVEALKKAQFPKSKRKATHLIVSSSSL
jgi:hypothetical protein